MTNIRRAENESDIRKITDLASVIWHEYFTPIIGEAQVEYMLKKFQSYEAVSEAVKNDGYVYYMAEDENGSLFGYLGARAGEDDVFLSKIYVEKSHRRSGTATKMLEEVKRDFAGKKYMWLTVNRHNDIAVETYKSLGFRLWREQVSDIGSGFVMDDYVFRLDLR